MVVVVVGGGCSWHGLLALVGMLSDYSTQVACPAPCWTNIAFSIFRLSFLSYERRHQTDFEIHCYTRKPAAAGLWICYFRNKVISSSTFFLLYIPGPEWVSFKYGVFVCLNCCGIHHSMSKVKSIKLDVWEDEMVEVGSNFNSLISLSWGWNNLFFCFFWTWEVLKGQRQCQRTSYIWESCPSLLLPTWGEWLCVSTVQIWSFVIKKVSSSKVRFFICHIKKKII